MNIYSDIKYDGSLREYREVNPQYFLKRILAERSVRSKNYIHKISETIEDGERCTLYDRRLDGRIPGTPQKYIYHTIHVLHESRRIWYESHNRGILSYYEVDCSRDPDSFDQTVERLESLSSQGGHHEEF